MSRVIVRIGTRYNEQCGKIGSINCTDTEMYTNINREHFDHEAFDVTFTL